MEERSQTDMSKGGRSTEKKEGRKESGKMVTVMAKGATPRQRRLGLLFDEPLLFFFHFGLAILLAGVGRAQARLNNLGDRAVKKPGRR